MSIINWIRNNKLTGIAELPAAIKSFDSTIVTTSAYTVYYDLFRKHYTGLNHRRLVEFIKFINKNLNKLPPVSDCEGTMSKIRSLVKQAHGYDSSPTGRH